MERQYVVNCSALWTGGRAAEGTGLLNRRTGYTGTAGSNPALSVEKHAFERVFYLFIETKRSSIAKW
tara:strand:- start:74 stop:274 length:201 start_codon:yes stop_codon:yes gene_type:complete